MADTPHTPSSFASLAVLDEAVGNLTPKSGNKPKYQAAPPNNGISNNSANTTGNIRLFFTGAGVGGVGGGGVPVEGVTTTGVGDGVTGVVVGGGVGTTVGVGDDVTGVGAGAVVGTVEGAGVATGGDCS